MNSAAADERYAAVRRMFDGIAPRYDLVNRLMTGGLDGWWRTRAARAARVPAGGLVLDLGTGTGDLALEVARRTPDVTVIGADYSTVMLSLAPAKARSAGLAAATVWTAADAHRLPLPDGVCDAVTSAFVLRNLADLPRAVAEMARVLKPGGVLVALEASPPPPRTIARLIGLYTHLVVPRLGRVLTGDEGAYRYLDKTVSAFLAPSEVAALVDESGLRSQPPELLMAGTIVIHRGVKPVTDSPVQA